MTETLELTKKLRFLVSLNKPENGGPYQGYAAADCVETMEKAADHIRALEARVEVLEHALRPFADVCEHDIGLSEDSGELFKPMSGQYAIAPLLRVGHFRNARLALEDSQ